MTDNEWEMAQKIADLEKENAELKKEAELAHKALLKINEVNKKLAFRNCEYKAQIEKMKCCGNCRHNEMPHTKESIRFCLDCMKYDKEKDDIILPKWENWVKEL